MQLPLPALQVELAADGFAVIPEGVGPDGIDPVVEWDWEEALARDERTWMQRQVDRLGAKTYYAWTRLRDATVVCLRFATGGSISEPKNNLGLDGLQSAPTCDGVNRAFSADPMVQATDAGGHYPQGTSKISTHVGTEIPDFHFTRRNGSVVEQKATHLPAFRFSAPPGHSGTVAGLRIEGEGGEAIRSPRFPPYTHCGDFCRPLGADAAEIQSRSGQLLEHSEARNAARQVRPTCRCLAHS